VFGLYTVIITHYHHDHYLYRREHIRYYKGKNILAKNPNAFINESQRRRAEEFYSMIRELLGLQPLKNKENSHPSFTLDSIKETIKEGLSRHFGDYQDRRMFLLKRGEEWLKTMIEKWKKWVQMRELEGSETRVTWIDSSEIDVGCMRIKFTHPLFHGIEYSKLGWVIGVEIEAGNSKIFYTSDVNGPIIEDYASLIIKKNPDLLILDGPPAYLLGYTLNKINLKRAVDNASRIILEADSLSTIIYDHHLVRERFYRRRTEEVWNLGKRKGVKVMTAAEYLGRKPVLDDK
jgi:predicted metallo-beta-lactamase superfamily hydrolase